jgi:hypothetical protein
LTLLVRTLPFDRFLTILWLLGISADQKLKRKNEEQNDSLNQRLFRRRVSHLVSESAKLRKSQLGSYAGLLILENDEF